MQQPVWVAHNGRQATDRPRLCQFNRMRASAKLGDDFVAEGWLDHQVAGSGCARVKRFLKMTGMKQRLVDALLQVHAVMHQPQEQDQLPLILLVATRRAKRQCRSALVVSTGRRNTLFFRKRWSVVSTR